MSTPLKALGVSKPVGGLGERAKEGKTRLQRAWKEGVVNREAYESFLLSFASKVAVRARERS